MKIVVFTNMAILHSVIFFSQEEKECFSEEGSEPDILR